VSGPKGITIDAAGNVRLADCKSHSIRMIDAKTGTIELIAGTGTTTDPLQCGMARPHGIFADADGGIYIGDSESHKIRVLRRK
jgi:streptogramin lyase